MRQSNWMFEQARRLLRPAVFRSLFVMLLIACGSSTAAAACSTWMDRAYFNEFFFGPSGGGNPPNFLEIYSSDNAFPASWQGWTIDLHTGGGGLRTYPFTNNTASACTKSSKTWVTYSAAGSLDGGAGLLILKDAAGNPVDAFAFDNTAPPAPWTSSSSNWAPTLASSCPTLANRLTNQANASVRPSNQPNMLIWQNQGNKDYARVPDGGGNPFFITSETGSGTTYTSCTTNNTNLSKTVESPNVAPGGTASFLLTFSNTGNSALSNITITDTVPAGLINVTATPSTGSGTVVTPYTTDASGNTVVQWVISSLPSNSTATLTLTAQVPANAAIGAEYTNNAVTSGVSPAQSDAATVTVISPQSQSFKITADSYSVCRGATAGGNPSAPIITVTAMDAVNGTGSQLTTYTGTATLTTSTGHGTWSKVSGAANGPLSGNVYTFVAADNGRAQFYLTNDFAETLYVTATDPTPSPTMTGSTESGVTYASATLSLAGADSVTPAPYTAVAGRNHRLTATTSACAGGAAPTGPIAAKIWYTPSINHPSTAAVNVSTSAACTAPVLLLTAPPATNNLILNFAAGSTASTSTADLYLCTTDVGQYALSLSTTTAQATSPNFTARPFVITVSGIGTPVKTNPAGQAPSDAIFTTAGSLFSAQFNAWRWASGADGLSTIPDIANDGIPNSTATLSQVSAAGRTPGFFANLRVGAALNTPAVGTAGVLGSASLGNGNPLVISVSAGTNTVSDLFYTEVGSFRLIGMGATGAPATTAVQDYLGAAGVNVPTLVFSDSGGQNNLVGRFTPHYFDTAATHGCQSGNFTYSGQPFSVMTTAWGAHGGLTKNYSQSAGFAKTVTLSDGGDATRFSNNTNAAPHAGFVDGVWNRSDVAYTFEIPRTVPKNLALRAIDSEGVSSAGRAEGATLIRSGRLFIDSAYGSEVLDLPVRLAARFWNGTNWAVNVDDNCTTMASLGLNFSSYTGSLTATNMSNAQIQASGGLVAGEAVIKLLKPSPSATGSVILESGLAHLPGKGRETFGAYKSRFIYLRERY